MGYVCALGSSKGLFFFFLIFFPSPLTSPIYQGLFFFFSSELKKQKIYEESTYSFDYFKIKCISKSHCKAKRQAKA